MAERVLTVGVVGGLGLMASPMAQHWTKEGSPVRVSRVHDRGTSGEQRERCREAWRRHGAALVPTFEQLVGAGDLDGVFVCAGKNGDDLKIIAKLAALLSQNNSGSPFICHLSTVSGGFVRAADQFCNRKKIAYVNYPLTGGPRGAENASMLILAAGDQRCFDRLAPALSFLGKPKYFGERITAGTEVKLIGHLMVFNGLLGICSAAALHAECFNAGRIGGPQQSEFFDFLNAGAGGTKQWDVIVSSGIRDDVWDAPFLLSYAVIDAIYAAHLCMERGISRLAVRPIIDTALAFSYVLNCIGPGLATHAIVREMVADRARELDDFIARHAGPADDINACIERCTASLPAALQRKMALSLSADDFAL